MRLPFVPPAAEQRVHLAYVLDSFETGGTELSAVRTAEHLVEHGFQLSGVVLRDEGSLRARYDEIGVPITEYPIRSLASVGAVRQAYRIAKELRRKSVQVVHCHDRYSNVLGVFAARIAGLPVIASRRWWTFDRRAHAVSNACAYRLADRVVANSQQGADLLIREGIDATKVQVVENFIEDHRFQRVHPAARSALLAQLGAEQDAILIGIVANLRPVKDHASLLRAVALLATSWPTMRLVCVGSGPALSALESLARELNIASRVHFLGHQADAARFHGCFDVSVLCSLHEGFPNSVIEAMAAGRPVVSTRVGGIPDAVVDEETGLLVAPQAPEELARALERLLHSVELRERMGRAGQDRARSVYHVNVVLPKLMTLYRSLAGANATERFSPTTRASSDRALVSTPSPLE